MKIFYKMAKRLSVQLSVPTFLTLNVDFMFDIERLYLAVDYD